MLQGLQEKRFTSSPRSCDEKVACLIPRSQDVLCYCSVCYWSPCKEIAAASIRAGTVMQFNCVSWRVTMSCRFGGAASAIRSTISRYSLPIVHPVLAILLCTEQSQASVILFCRSLHHRESYHPTSSGSATTAGRRKTLNRTVYGSCSEPRLVCSACIFSILVDPEYRHESRLCLRFAF